MLIPIDNTNETGIFSNQESVLNSILDKTIPGNKNHSQPIMDFISGWRFGEEGKNIITANQKIMKRQAIKALPILKDVGFNTTLDSHFLALQKPNPE